MQTPIKPNILVVDDDQTRSSILKFGLDNKKVIIKATSSPLEALKMANKIAFSIILLDLKMPQMSGFELAAEIRKTKINQKAPIIFITATAISEKEIFEGYEKGAFDYLIKPINPLILHSKIDAYIEIFQQNMILSNINKIYEFFSIVTHDLKSPLANIVSFNEFLKEGSTSKEDVKIYLEQMGIISKNALKMVQECLDIVNIYTGQTELKFEPFNASILCQKIIAEQTAQSSQKDVKLIDNITTNLTINGDEEYLYQVFENFIENAIKFSNKDDVITISLIEADDKVIFSVKDEGIGMSERITSKLLSKETNCSRAGTNSEPGTGYGLPLSEEILIKHDSKVQFESEVDQGSIFWFEIYQFLPF